MSTTIKDSEVSIENIGPIEELRLTAKPGTITVLTGPNGVGKTQALQAIDGLASGKSRLSNRDGTVGGSARGFGVTIKVGRGGSNRRSGDLEIESVEDRLNIADLIDPKVKDPIAADARRIKALVTLADVDANAELFYDLAGGKDQFLELIKPESIDKPDIVSLAAAVKRDFERASRKEAEVAENLERDIRARKEANEGIDVEAPHDADELQAALEQSLSNLATEKERAANAKSALEAASEARLRIEDSKSSYDGSTLEDAKTALANVRSEVVTQQGVINEIQKSLAEAIDEMTAIKHRADLAEMALNRADEHEDLISQWEFDVKASEGVEPPDDDVVLILESHVQLARDAIETGVRVRDALQRDHEAKLISVSKKMANLSAQRLRDAAHGTEDILSRLVAEMGGVFKVDKEFRLIVQHPKRGETYFSELSHGERWKLGLDVAIEAFQRTGQRGLLAIPQHAFESLDGKNRRLISEHIKGTDLAVITAEVSREEDAGAEIGVGTFE